MRGKQRQRPFEFFQIGITPADAGKTLMDVLLPVMIGDHPRGCGENVVRRAVNPRKLGSPPRMRGKRKRADGGQPFVRITPADAGKTSGTLKTAFPMRDHPRGCGENRWAGLSAVRSWGSPPRMRGKRVRSYNNRRRIRITPADAGKTRCR